MKKFTLAFLLLSSSALAQTPGSFTQGQTLSASALDAAFAGKQDYSASLTGAASLVANVVTYGAKCDGSTSDSAAFNAAQTALAAGGGGVIWVPSTGHACVLGSGIALGNSIVMAGGGAMRFPGSTATIAQWTATGTWIQCTDTVNPCITISGHGSAVKGVNFIYSQPIPGGSFTPTVYPYTILDKANWSRIENVNIIAGTHGISLTYPLANGGGVGTVIRDVVLSTLNVGMTFDGVNDLVVLDNIQVRPMYYASTPSMVTYLESNLTGMDIHYLDNPRITNYECYLCNIGMLFTDDTVLGNTHSMYNAELVNIQPNLGRIAMKVAASTTTVTGHVVSMLVQGDTANSLTDTQFQLNSDNVDLQFHGLNVNGTGGSIMNLGGGAGGVVSIDGYRGLGYSSVSAGQTGFIVNAGAQIQWGTRNQVKTAGSGTLFGGANAQNGVSGPLYAWTVFSTQAQVSSTGAGIGSFAAISTNNQTVMSNISGAMQVRLIGVGTVTTLQAASTFSVRPSQFQEAVASGACTATGAINVDSGWVDITSTKLSALGAIQFAATSGCIVTFGNLTMMVR